MNKRLTKLLKLGKVKKGKKKGAKTDDKRDGDHHRDDAAGRTAATQSAVKANRRASASTPDDEPGADGLGGEVPGPDADKDTLRAWARDQVGYRLATLPYNRVRATCAWCLSEGEELLYTEVRQKGGTRKFCTERCAEAREAWANTWSRLEGRKEETECEEPSTSEE